MATIDLNAATANDAVGEADLALLDGRSLTDPDISARPQGYYTAMRVGDPVHYDEKLGMYLVSRYEDIQTVQRDPITYSVQHGYSEQYAKGFMEEFQEILKRDGGGFFPDAIMSDPPYHTRIRRLMENAFTAHRVKALEGGIRDIIVEVIEGCIAKSEAGEEVDAVKDFAVPITIHVICEQLGIAQFNADNIQRWSHAVTQQIGRMQDREQMLGFARDICELQNFLIAEVKKREAEPSEDMISDMVHAKADDSEGDVGGNTLNFPEVVSLVRATMIAGNETTATAMTNLVYILATRPDVLKMLHDSIDDDRLMSRFVEELLRFAPPVRGLSRMTTAEVELGGKVLPKGAHMLLMYASANDDETEFAEPRVFDMNRRNLGRHVAFGGGPHKCIGIALARMEIRVAARELVKHITDIKLAIPEDEIAYLPTVATHSIARLPFTFKRRS